LAAISGDYESVAKSRRRSSHFESNTKDFIFGACLTGCLQAFAAGLAVTLKNSSENTMRVVSGIQPTGRPHWGNYFGAIQQYIQLQDEDQAFYFIANLHALTSIRDPKLMSQYTLDAAIDLLALGLDPNRAVLFVQSDVPEISELCWVLLSGTNMGLLERCVSYKDKIDKGLPTVAGLFTYPVLQAADILAYDSDIVPVGQDQAQHIEVCRDVAQSFNHQFGEVFVLPKAKVLADSAKVPGTDGEKMSKSYNNTIEIFESPKEMRKKVMRIATDSRPMEDAKEPDEDHLYQLYSLFVGDDDRAAMAAKYRAGGFGYGEVKKAIADAAEAFFAQAHARRNELVRNPDEVRSILAAGAAKARAKASQVLFRAQKACGIAY
jgi:tryptophanyl-tRNA synthetase